MRIKKGDKIKVSEENNYNGRDMKWTELPTRKVILSAGTKLFHFSDNKVSSFAPIETCFFDDFDNYGHTYVVELLEDCKATEYHTETRCDLSHLEVKIIYLGERRYRNKKTFELNTKDNRIKVENNYIVKEILWET